MIFSNSIISHYQLRGRGLPSAPDVAVFPGLNIIPPPPVPTPRRTQGRRTLPMLRRRTASTTFRHNEIPPVTRSGRSHARIKCEVAVSQDLIDWEEKCERWMR
ncbi:12589_t:CDS:2 [Funneliformis geosporum]|nr:12589_t:CDS:2 [Funneliformis geosporum]